MQKLTTAEAVVPFLVFMAGIGGMTLAAWHYPDSDILQIIGLILTMGAVIAVAFYFSRARKKST
jgi:hypothetical protein